MTATEITLPNHAQPALLFQNDLSAEEAARIKAAGSVAIDTETLGLSLTRDKLCLVQLATEDGRVSFVQFPPETRAAKDGNGYHAPNLAGLLTDPVILKLFHFGRFDIAQLKSHLGALAAPVFCTKIASKLVRTFTDRHGLGALVKDLLTTEISKQQQTSDWGAPTLTAEQLVYAANDVIYLHRLRDRLAAMLARENRTVLAQRCFEFLPIRATLDLAGWPDMDIFEH